MKILRVFFRILQFLLGLLLLAAIVALLYIGLREWFQWFSNLDNSLAGAIATAGMALVGLIYSQSQIKKRDIAEQHRPKKVETYEALFTFLQYMDEHPDLHNLSKEEATKIQFPDEIREIIWRLNKGLLIWSSPKVVTAWLNYRLTAQRRQNGLKNLDLLLRAIRKDLGNSNFGLKQGDAVRSYLKNPEEYDAFELIHKNTTNK